MFKRQLMAHTLLMFFVLFLLCNGFVISWNSALGKINVESYKENVLNTYTSPYGFTYNRNIVLYSALDSAYTLNSNANDEKQILKNKLKQTIDIDSNRAQLEFCYVYKIDEALDKIIQLKPQIEKQSLDQNVPKELIAAVIFREMMFYQKADQFFDQFDKKNTIGLAQISVAGVRFNDDVIAKKENITPTFKGYSDDEIFKMLQDDNYNVTFVAMALKRCAYCEGKSILSINEGDIKTIFATYNQNSGPEGILKKICNNPIIRIPFYSMNEYGEQTYNYYLAFEDYYDVNESK